MRIFPDGVEYHWSYHRTEQAAIKSAWRMHRPSELGRLVSMINPLNTDIVEMRYFFAPEGWIEHEVVRMVDW